MNILLIEDDELVRNGMQTLLERRGHTVFTYNRGEGAAQYALELGADITVVDYNLGDHVPGDIIVAELADNGRRVMLMSGEDRRKEAVVAGVPFVLKSKFWDMVNQIEEGRAHADT